MALILFGYVAGGLCGSERQDPRCMPSSDAASGQSLVTQLSGLVDHWEPALDVWFTMTIQMVLLLPGSVAQAAPWQ